MIDVEKLKEMSVLADRGLKELEIINMIEDEALREHLLDCYREYKKKDGLKMLLELNQALGGEAIDTDGTINDAIEAIIRRTFNPALAKDILESNKEE